MFPNDDICNVEVAKMAAMRLFKKYKRRGNTQESGLGKKEVNRLMRATYDAINMPYDPNEEDVFSFMSVFDSNNDGNIELQDIESIALKYLCGIQSLSKPTSIETISNHSIQKQKSSPYTQPTSKYSSNEKQQPYQKNKINNDNKLTIKIEEPVNQPTKIRALYSPNQKPQPQPISAFYSPKNTHYQPPFTQPTKISKPVIEIDAIIRSGQLIFNRYANAQCKGIRESQAKYVIADSYSLFNKTSYIPNTEDIQVWMKLCSKPKSNFVDWQGYQHFLIKTYEREQQNSKH